MNHVTALSPLDGRYADKCEDLQQYCSEYGLIYYRVQVELEWFKALASHPEIKELPALSDNDIEFIDNILACFDPQEAEAVKEIEKTTNHDVKAVEYYIAEQFRQHDRLKNETHFIHFACTSEDINNIAYALMLKSVQHGVMNEQFNRLLGQIEALAYENKDVAMLARTHGQTATPTTLGKELLNVQYRLERQVYSLLNMNILAKINGATGNYNAHLTAYPNINWLQISQDFIENLGLTCNPLTTQIEPHDNLAEFLQNLSRINTICIDLCRDIWSYISIGYFKQKHVQNEVGSSTMPHKVNPIDFENAEGNLGIANALCEHMAAKLPISRWQRDLSDSTVLRNIGVIFGYTVIAFQAMQKGLNKLETNHVRIEEDLTQSPEVLTEAIQTVMRKHGITDAYEQVKNLSRNQTINLDSLHAFINTLDIPNDDKIRLKSLKPSDYVGFAPHYFTTQQS